MIRKNVTGAVSLPIILLLLTDLASPVMAQPERSILFSVGQAVQDMSDMQSQLQGLGYTALGINRDERATAWSVGYRHPLNIRWSADIQYLQQGKTEPQVQATLPFGKTTDAAARDAAEAMPKRGQGVSAVALYHYPISKGGLSLQLGGGAFIWQSERTASVAGSTYTSEDQGVSPMLQLGISYPLSANSRVELQLQHMLMPDEAVARAAIGVSLNF